MKRKKKCPKLKTFDDPETGEQVPMIVIPVYPNQDEL